jgi:hypothetical protein
MKLVLVLSAAAALVGAHLWIHGPPCCHGTCPLKTLVSSEPDPSGAPSGGYVEARTVNVFAGACHYNGEATSSGRQAVLAWSFESGSYEGADLAGVDVIAAVSSSANLDRADLAEGVRDVRRSILYVDAGASEAQREAAAKYVRERCGDALGEVIAVETRDVEVEIANDRYAARAGDELRLEGAALPDRECCRMPYQVWYEPLAPIEGRIVGNSDDFEWRVERLAPSFERHSQNDAFLGTFGAIESKNG